MAVYDSKARVFLQPMYCSHMDVGIRTFATVANQAGHQIAENPADFTLWHLGSWDDDNGVFALSSPYTNLGFATQFKKETRLVQHENS